MAGLCASVALYFACWSGGPLKGMGYSLAAYAFFAFVMVVSAVAWLAGGNKKP